MSTARALSAREYAELPQVVARARDFCGLADDTGPGQQKTALDQYQAIVSDLQVAAAGKVTQQIEISLIGDSAFAAAESADPTAAMLARLNIVEGIFSEQLGLLVLATDVRVMSASDDPFTSTKGSTLHRTASAAVTRQTRLLQPMRRSARGEAPQAIAWTTPSTAPPTSSRR